MASKVKVTARDADGKVLGEHITSEDGRHTPVTPVVDLGSALSPWVVSGVYGVIAETRQGVTTVPAVELMDACGRIADALLKSGGTMDAIWADMIDPATADGLDLRYMADLSIPDPSAVLPSLVAYRTWPSILLSPTHARVGVGFSMDETGRCAIVVAAKRHVMPRKAKAA